MFNATLYDGVTAHPHQVSAAISDGALELNNGNGWGERVEWPLVRRVESSRGQLRLGRTDVPGWRLIISPDAESAIAPMLGKQDRYGRWIDRIGLVPAVFIGAVVTAAVVAIGHLAPHWIAPHVPIRWEHNVGTALVGDFGSNRCRSVKGQQALEALVERVAPGATKGPDGIRISALDIPIFNAAALPGGYIVVFKPAITETDPEALAGILAHEVAHVRRRHVTEALIRELGIGAIVRLFAGNLGANAEQIVSLSYTRDNEAQADADAIAMLRRADISPLATARLFKKLSREAGESAGFSTVFLRSHPLSAARAARFANAFDRRAHYSPPLNRDQQDALFDICSTRTQPKSN